MDLSHLSNLFQGSKVVFIGNPSAGIHWMPAKLDFLIKILTKSGFKVELHLSDNPVHINELAKHVQEDISAIFIGGGDGTLNQVINGLMDPSKIPLVLIPWGTSNSIARGLGISGSMESLMRLFQEGRIIRMDMGIINKKRFMLCAGFGFDGQVAKALSSMSLSFRGYSRYLIPFLKTLVSYRANPMIVELNNQLFECELAIVGNLPLYGWRLKVTDKASCVSGHLDVCMFRKGSGMVIFYYGILALLGIISRRKGIKYMKTQGLFIDSQVPIPIQVDGDFFGRTPARIKIRPSSVPVLGLTS